MRLFGVFSGEVDESVALHTLTNSLDDDVIRVDMLSLVPDLQ